MTKVTHVVRGPGLGVRVLVWCSRGMIQQYASNPNPNPKRQELPVGSDGRVKVA